MNLYEITYLISSQTPKKDLDSLRERIKSFVLEEQGSVAKSSIPVKKTLAFKIGGQKEAFLCDLTFSLKAEKLKGLSKKLKSEKQILRYLITNKEISKRRKPKKTVRTKFKEKPKVELKEIEKKLDEILNE